MTALSRKARRREIEGLNLSFLDVVSCGFGAIILLLVLARVFDPLVIEETITDLETHVTELQQQIIKLNTEARDISKEMLLQDDQQEEQTRQEEKLTSDLSALESEHEKVRDKTKVTSTVEKQLIVARQTLTEEMTRLLADYKRPLDENTIGGIPVDSEYVIFIIDTSGSMLSFAWPLVREKVAETLAVYPQLKGIQVMSDMGNYMFTQYADQWIPDTQVRRRAIIDSLETWAPFSNSSPVEGIQKAIATFYRPGRKISLYVFGDEFTGRSIQHVLDSVDRINQPDAQGERLVRIHGIGFPVMFAYPNQQQGTGIMFSILMRELCARNGGTFVGLNDFRAL